MPDEFKRLQPGDKLRPSARAWNTLMDVAKDRIARTSLSQDGIGIAVNQSVAVLNTTDDILPQFGVVGLGLPLPLPEENLDEFRARNDFNSIPPDPSERFAILRSPLQPGAIDVAAVSGMTACLVEMTDANHQYARPIADEYDRLTSTGTPAAATIHWRDTLPATAREPGITLHTEAAAPASEDGEDGDYWHDTDAGEWYGPKAAGAWGSGHAVGTGIVWAEVMLAQFPPVDVVAKIVTGERINGKYDVLVQPRDNANEEWDDATAAWAIDLSGSASLTAGDTGRYLGTYSGREVGGPYYVSLTADNTGNVLSDDTKWRPLIGYPGSAPLYVPSIVDAVDIANGNLTIVSGSSPTDFLSTLDIDIVDADSSITQGFVRITGTDVNGDEITDYVGFAYGGSATYTTEIPFKTVTAAKVFAVLGEASGDTIRVRVTSYPAGAVRVDSGSRYFVANLDGTANAPPHADWQEVTLSNRGAYSPETAYSSDDYVQETRPLYAIRSSDDDCCCPTPGASGGIAEFRYSYAASGWHNNGPGTPNPPEIGGSPNPWLEWEWICPECVTEVTVEAVGPGGSGTSGDTYFGSPDDPEADPYFYSTKNSGGGGGAYAMSVIKTTPGKTYLIRITDPSQASFAGCLGAEFYDGSDLNTSLVRAASGNHAEFSAYEGGYTGGAGHGKGGRASDCIGEVVASGGDGGEGSIAVYTPFSDPPGIPYMANGGGGGGSGEPDGDGANGGNAETVSFGYGPYPAAVGGSGYGKGGDGGNWDAFWRAGDFAPIVYSFSPRAAHGPGGGGPGHSYGPTSIELLDGGYAMVRISWGAGLSVNGESGAVMLTPENGLSVTATGSGIIRLSQKTLHYGVGPPSSTLGASGDGYIDLDTGDFYWTT